MNKFITLFLLVANLYLWFTLGSELAAFSSGLLLAGVLLEWFITPTINSILEINKVLLDAKSRKIKRDMEIAKRK